MHALPPSGETSVEAFALPPHDAIAAVLYNHDPDLVLIGLTSGASVSWWLGTISTRTLERFCDDTGVKGPMPLMNGLNSGAFHRDGQSLVFFGDKQRHACTPGTPDEAGTRQVTALGLAFPLSQATLGTLVADDKGLLVVNPIQGDRAWRLTWNGAVEDIVGTEGVGYAVANEERTALLLGSSMVSGGKTTWTFERLDAGATTTTVLAQVDMGPCSSSQPLVLTEHGVVVRANQCPGAEPFTARAFAQGKDVAFYSAASQPAFIETSGAGAVVGGVRVDLGTGKTTKLVSVLAGSHVEATESGHTYTFSGAFDTLSATVGTVATFPEGAIGSFQLSFSDMHVTPSPDAAQEGIEQERQVLALDDGSCVIWRDAPAAPLGWDEKKETDTLAVAPGTVRRFVGHGFVSWTRCGEAKGVFLARELGGFALAIPDAVGTGRTLRHDAPVLVALHGKKRAATDPKQAGWQREYTPLHSAWTMSAQGQPRALFHLAERYFLRPFGLSRFFIERDGKLFLVNP